MTDEFFFAVAGEGATCNGGSDPGAAAGPGLDGTKLARPKRFLGSLAELHPSVVPLPRIGSLALRLARVAHGEVDISHRRAATATTGTLRQPIFWCTKPAAR